MDRPVVRTPHWLLEAEIGKLSVKVVSSKAMQCFNNWNLTPSDLENIIESLSYPKKVIEEYPMHHSYEFKKDGLNKIDEVRAMKKSSNS